MKTRMMDDGSTRGGGRVEGEGTYNGGMTTEQMAGLEPLSGEADSTDAAGNTTDSPPDSGANTDDGDQ